MNICFFTSEHVYPTSGGVERVVYNLSRIMMDRGANVCIISAHNTRHLDYVYNTQHISKNPDKIMSPENLSQIDSLLSSFDIEVVINASHQSEMYELAKISSQKTGAKLISTLYCTPDALIKGLEDECAEIIFKEGKKINKFFNVLLSYLLRPYKRYKRRSFLRFKYGRQYDESDVFVLESERYKPLFLNLIKRDDGNKLRAILNPLSLFPKVNIENREKNVLFISRMVIRQKRPDRMLRIWKSVEERVNDWRLIMIGDGDDKEAMINYSSRLGLHRVEFVGNSDLSGYYQKSEILCMTSTFEGFGLVLTEALQNGVIPIAFNSYAAVQDIIDDNNTGFLIEPFDLQAYRNRLLLLMTNSKKRNQIRDSIMKMSLDKYSEDVIGVQWMTLINEIS